MLHIKPKNNSFAKISKALNQSNLNTMKSSNLPSKVNPDHLINGQIYEGETLEEIKAVLKTLDCQKKIKQLKDKPLKYSVLLSNDDKDEGYVLYNQYKKILFIKEAGYLGMGRFARVKLVQHILTNEWYAAKIIIKSSNLLCCLNPAKTEIAILKKLGLLKSVIETKKKIYIIQKLCSGAPLYHLPSTDNIDAIKVISIVYQLICYMKKIHEKQILHADLHPGNILYDSNSDHLEIIDYGAGFITSDGSAWRMDWIGIPDYTAPEVTSAITGINYYTEATDWYAVGKNIQKLFYEYHHCLEKESIGLLTHLIKKFTHTEPNKRAANIDTTINQLAVLHDKLKQNGAKKPSGNEIIIEMGSSTGALFQRKGFPGYA